MSKNIYLIDDLINIIIDFKLSKETIEIHELNPVILKFNKCQLVVDNTNKKIFNFQIYIQGYYFKTYYVKDNFENGYIIGARAVNLFLKQYNKNPIKIDIQSDLYARINCNHNNILNIPHDIIIMN